MITKFDSLFAGHIDLDNVGYAGTAVNDRRFANPQLVTVFDKAQAMAQLPAEARGLFKQLVVPYREGDAADYQFSRSIAEGMIEGFHPELAITTVEDPAVIHWFFEALQRLGIGALTSQQQEQIELFLRSA